MKNRFLLALTAVVFTASLGTAVARTWTRSSDGKTIEGDYLRMKDDSTVVIRVSGGQSRELPISALSQEDQDFVKSKMETASTDKAEPAAEEGDGSEIVLSGVHLCCGGCKKGVESAIAGMEDVTVDFGSDELTLKAKSARDTQKALDAIAKAGYYGTSSHSTVKIGDEKAGDSEKESVTVTGTHLCCGKCIKAIDKVVAGLDGAESHTAEKGADTFVITGKVKPIDVLNALHAVGMTGKVE